MDSLVILIGIVTLLVVFGAFAVAFGAESRDGFTDDCDPAGLR